MIVDMFKKLTLFSIGFSLFLSIAYAEVLKQESNKSHYRWNLFTAKNNVIVKKEDGKVIIQTLSLEFFNKLSAELQTNKRNKNYIKKLQFNSDGFPEKPAEIVIELASKDIETFSFYRDQEKKYIIDFWVDDEKRISARVSEFEKEKRRRDLKESKEIIPNPKIIKKANKNKVVAKVEKSKTQKIESPYRDFRYGLALIWDYKPILPAIKKRVNIQNKTADFFYEIKDRNYKDDEKEAHLQLNINLYRKEKWGLLNKSITIYEQKYKVDENYSFNEFLKANSLLKKHVGKKDIGPRKAALNILENITQRSKDYEMRRACFRYLNQYYMDQKDYVNSIKLLKRQYVDSAENFDEEESKIIAENILHNLAKMNQLEQLKEFLSDKIVKRLIAKEYEFSFPIYLHLKTGSYDQVLREYKNAQKKYGKITDPSIIYNVAETLFRTAKYKEAITLFDKLATDFSYLDVAPNARLRIAMSYDLLDKAPLKVGELYKRALNRSSSPAIRYEAKLRYVGLMLNRKKNPTAKEIEYSALLEYDRTEKSIIKDDLKKAMWLIRLRSFIAKKEYDKALTYLAAIPLERMKPVEKRLFQGDGAEIIYGLIKQLYSKGDYAGVAKIWETYKGDYVDKVALDPYVNYIVCMTYLRLNLKDSFQRTLNAYRGLKNTPSRTYPIWIKRRENINSNMILAELAIIESHENKDWAKADKVIKLARKSFKDFSVLDYYEGVNSYKQKKYTKAQKSFEKFLVKSKPAEVFTDNEIADLFHYYLDSLYQANETEKFKTASEAMLSDTSKLSSQNPVLNKMHERIRYLLIEVYAGEEKKNSQVLAEALIQEFIKNHKESIYNGRIRYLLGRTLIKNKKSDEGKKILNELLNDEKVSNYIKELAKSELATLKINELTL